MLLACRRVVNIAEPVHLAAGGITDEACPSAAGTCTSSTLLSLYSRIAAVHCLLTFSQLSRCTTMPPTRKRNLSVGDDITILSTSKKCKNKVQSNAIDHAINSVISQSQPCPPSPPPIDNGKATSSKVDKGSSISKMQTEISHLQSVIATQSKEIARLTHQLSVVMTYLEIGDGPVVPVPVPVGGAGSTGNAD